MPKDRDDSKRPRILTALRDMLGLPGDAFLGAMKEAVWVPGGVDQLADIVVRSFSGEDLVRLIDELPDDPEMMALIGRILVTLSEHPDREALGQAVMERARAAGPKAVQYLSPYSWYPPKDQIEEILVSRHRLHDSHVTLRMRWGGEYQGIEAIWHISYAIGEVGEVYFVTEEASSSGYDESAWQTIDLDHALGLITAAGMVQSAVNNRFPFDGMTGVGLWMVLAGGREVIPWIDAAYALEHDEATARETVLAEGNALSAGDLLLAYDLLDPSLRPADVLDYIDEQMARRPELGRLWRLDVEPNIDEDRAARMTLYGWYLRDGAIWDRVMAVETARDADSHWRIRRWDVTSERPLPDADLDQYLTMHPRYFAVLPVYDLESLAELLPETSEQLHDGVLAFASGNAADYLKPYDVATSQAMLWMVMLEDDGQVVVVASDELSLRREVQHLAEQGAAGEPYQTGMMNLMDVEQLKAAAKEGPEALASLLDGLPR